MAESLTDYSLRRTEKQTKKGGLKKVGVVGCGNMGQQIVRLISQHELEVVFIELSADRIDEILKDIAATLDKVINKWGLTESDKRAILSRISGSTDYNDIKDCQMIIETINIKKRGSSVPYRMDVFKKIESVVSEDAIIASNNATLMISDLASVLKHPERAVGLNFITPASKVKIVEVIKGLQTSESALDFTVRFVKMLDKRPITLIESPGNISTRLFVPLINEACELLMEGVASVSCIDETMKLGFGLQLGPFELADRVGIDKVQKWMDNLYQEFGTDKFKPSPIIKRLVRANLLGRKVSRGFYNYENEKIISQTINVIEFNL
jgi:3-hydroxybutyryl-CoA dehydrogenase